MEEINENIAVARLSEMLALKCGVHPDVAKRLRSAAALHDAGKIKIPDSIVNKAGKLNKEEFEIMKRHTLIGAEMLESIQGELGIMARLIAKYHHEWYDSTGSYWGRYSCELPAYVSIVSMCDVFVALLSQRPYKDAWPPKEAIGYIESKAGTQFNPVLTEAFICLVRNCDSLPAILTDE